MKIALQYKDEKSEKFWWIQTLDSDFVVNYGKIGAIGRYQIKEFDDNESCLKEAEKQVSSKMKKGYAEVDFDFDNHLYIDDEEIGLHPLTSHPNFVKHFSNVDLYYNCGDEEAPFGSDCGADALALAEEAMRRNSKLNFLDFPQQLVESPSWDMKYLPVDSLDEADVKKVLASDLKYNLITSDQVTYATAFAQIKITGRLSKELKRRAIMALKRMDVVGVVEGWMPADIENEITSMQIRDLESFDNLE